EPLLPARVDADRMPALRAAVGAAISGLRAGRPEARTFDGRRESGHAGLAALVAAPAAGGHGKQDQGGDEQGQDGLHFRGLPSGDGSLGVKRNAVTWSRSRSPFGRPPCPRAARYMFEAQMPAALLRSAILMPVRSTAA